MPDCYLCDLMKNENLDNLIMENENAMVTFIDETREGQCLVFTKKHRKSMTVMDMDDWNSVADIIKKVSRALEKKYDCEKTYLLCISDKVEHIHFHIIPKHKNLKSMGYYCFARVWDEEGKRETPEAELKARAQEIKGLIDK